MQFWSLSTASDWQGQYCSTCQKKGIKPTGHGAQELRHSLYLSLLCNRLFLQMCFLLYGFMTFCHCKRNLYSRELKLLLPICILFLYHKWRLLACIESLSRQGWSSNTYWETTMEINHQDIPSKTYYCFGWNLFVLSTEAIKKLSSRGKCLKQLWAHWQRPEIRSIFTFRSDLNFKCAIRLV